MKARVWKVDGLARWAGEASVARIRAGIARARDDDVRCLRIVGPEIEPPYGGTEDDDPRWSDILRRVVG